MANVGLTWTEERIERLKELWTEGLSASQIAAELGGDVSRNAVISKANRLGLAHARAKEGARRGHASRAARRSRPNKLSLLPSKIQPRCPARERAAYSAARSDRCPSRGGRTASMGVTIMELREFMCRWPLGDPTTPEFRYCGARANEGLPYCPHHAQIAYQPATERKRLRA